MHYSVENQKQAKRLLTILLISFPLMFLSALILKGNIWSKKPTKASTEKAYSKEGYNGYTALICTNPLTFLITNSKLKK